MYIFNVLIMFLHVDWFFFFNCQVIYEVTVVTGDVQNAGTDTKIYMSVFGANGSTEEMLLQKNEDRYLPLGTRNNTRRRIVWLYCRL